MPRFALALAVLVACTDPPETPATYQAGLFPNVAHSGFAPSTSFKVMFATSAPNPQWAVTDPSIATIVPSAAPTIHDPNPDGGAQITVDTRGLSFALATMLKAGDTTVTMTSGGTVLTSQLSVKAYTDDQVQIGTARYNEPSTDPSRPPCASCHQKPGGVDHSPLKMAGFDDPTILDVIQNATYPKNSTGQSITSDYAPTGPLSLPTHKWNLTDPEKDGILARLRSLPLGGVQ